MAYHHNLIDTSNELLFQCWGNGIKLTRPDKKGLPFTHPENTVAKVLQLPCNVYFLNTEGRMQNSNEVHIATFALSLKYMLGKNVFDFTKRDCAEKIRKNDIETMNSKKINITEEELFSDKIDWTGITIKLPWYNDANKVTGIFGCTIVLGQQKLDESLLQIAQLGLLNRIFTRKESMLPGIQIKDTYFSKRQKEIIHFIVRGKTVREIASTLGLSNRTVGHYLEHIKTKMGVTSKSELIEKAFDYLNPYQSI